MKLLTPRPARPRPGITGGATSTASIGLTRVGLGVFLLGWLATTAVALIGFNAARRPVERLQAAKHHAAVDALAARISGRLARIQATLVGLAADPVLASALTSGNAGQLHLQAARLKHLFPAALGVRLLPPVDDLSSNSRGLSYAALDMLQRAAVGTAPVEVDFPGETEQRVSLVQAVRTVAGGQVAGNILVSFPISLVHELLKGQRAGNGYLQLRQVSGNGSAVGLSALGRATARQGAPAARVAIAGTRWQLVLWANDGTILRKLFVHILVVYGIAVVAWGLAVLVLFRLLAGALRTDLATAIGLVKSGQSGVIPPPYRARLAECRGTLDMLRDLARTRRREAAAAATTTAPPTGVVQGD